MSESPNRKLQDQFMLRLPDGMRDRIRQRADRTGRSMNSVIVDVLEEAFPDYFTDTETLALAAAAAQMFSHHFNQADDFTNIPEIYDELLEFLKERFPDEDPQRLLEANLRNSTVIEAVSVPRLHQWLQAVFFPWRENREAEW